MVDDAGRVTIRLARLHGVQEVLGSNPSAPTNKRPLSTVSGRLSGFLFNKIMEIHLKTKGMNV